MDPVLAFSAGTTLGILGLGFLLGLKHATEADHLAAVSTIVSERRCLFSSAIVGGVWGLGHTISLLIAGVLVLLLNYEISEGTERLLEFFVGVMLVLLGLNVLRKLLSGGHLHFHSHEHGEHAHTHPHVHEFDEAADPATHHGLKFTPRALLVGMVHGMAGSAALMLLVIPTIDAAALGLLYIAVFGIGSIGGMMLMSFLVGLPFHFTALKFHRFNHLLQGLAGIISVALGLWIVYEKGFSERLFV
jgi:ABC-type nickel/cobalt efflux system permease component RcnA